MSRYGEPNKTNPHPRLVDEPAHQCPWCDGTGLHGRAAYGVPTRGRGPHHEGCSFLVVDTLKGEHESACNGSVEWRPCVACKATGDIRNTPATVKTADGRTLPFETWNRKPGTDGRVTIWSEEVRYVAPER